MPLCPILSSSLPSPCVSHPLPPLSPSGSLPDLLHSYSPPPLPLCAQPVLSTLPDSPAAVCVCPCLALWVLLCLFLPQSVGLPLTWTPGLLSLTVSPGSPFLSVHSSHAHAQLGRQARVTVWMGRRCPFVSHPPVDSRPSRPFPPSWGHLGAGGGLEQANGWPQPALAASPHQLCPCPLTSGPSAGVQYLLQRGLRPAQRGREIGRAHV